MTNASTHILFLLDRSGSMDSIKGDVIGGFNSFLDEQKTDKDGDLFVSLIQFDSSDPFEVITERSAIDDILKLDETTFIPRGMTPLLDAIAETVDWGEKEAVEDDDAVVLVIFTDGMENGSRNKSRSDIKELIQKKEDDGWTVVYLGANQDAYGEASSTGIRGVNTSNFVADPYGTKTAFADVSRGVTQYRNTVMASTASGQSMTTKDFYGDIDKDADKDAEERA